MVRHSTLTAAFAGSNPATSARKDNITGNRAYWIKMRILSEVGKRQHKAPTYIMVWGYF